MIIYIDENIPPNFAKGFDLLQGPITSRNSLPIEVKSIVEEFGKGAKDEDWIRLAGKEDSCILTQDFNIRRIQFQRELCEENKLGMFYLRAPSKNGFRYWEMVAKLVKHWEEVISICQNEERPFAYRITARSSKLEKM